MSEEGEEEVDDEVRTQNCDRNDKLADENAKVLSQGDDTEIVRAKARRRLEKTKSQASKASSMRDVTS